jgi:enoyl-CoA hydratase
MSSGAMIITKKRDTFIEILLNRPDKRNALSSEMSLQFSSALDELTGIDLPLVIRSMEPGMFVAGADVDSLRRRTLEQSLARVNESLFEKLAAFPMPTVALVDGPALGGGMELALACDLRICTSNSTWGLPEVTLGLVPAAGGMWRLESLVGRSRAVEMVLTGAIIDGIEAGQIGLAQRVATVERFADDVDLLLKQLSRGSSLALKLAKQCMAKLSPRGGIEGALAQAICLSDKETLSRLDTFLDRSVPYSKSKHFSSEA